MRALLVLLVFAGCSHEEEETSLLNLWVVGDVCPNADEAFAPLWEIWGGGGTEIDGDHCRASEFLEIVPTETKANRPTCCYATTCSAPLDVVGRERLHRATCHGGECARYDLTRFTRESAETKLAESGLECTVDRATTPIDTTGTQCWYRTTARYICEG